MGRERERGEGTAADCIHIYMYVPSLVQSIQNYTDVLLSPVSQNQNDPQ